MSTTGGGRIPRRQAGGSRVSEGRAGDCRRSGASPETRPVGARTPHSYQSVGDRTGHGRQSDWRRRDAAASWPSQPVRAPQPCRRHVSYTAVASVRPASPPDRQPVAIDPSKPA